MAAPFTLAQLLTPSTLPELRTRFLALLQGKGFPAITEWLNAAAPTEMNFVNMVVRALNDLAHSGADVDRRLASIAASGFLKYARGSWLTLLAAGFYRLERVAAGKTTFDLLLQSVSTAPPYTFEPGDLWMAAPSGKRYQSTTGGALAPGGSLLVSFAAEEAGSAYADNPETTNLQLATPFAGVSFTTRTGDFTPVTHSGDSTGVFVVGRMNAGIVPTPHSFEVRIDTTGEAGTAYWSLRTDGGVWVPQTPLTVLGNPVGGNSGFDALYGSPAPSWRAGDVFAFSTPGTPGFTQGADEETDDALIARCRGRWPALADNVLDAKVVLWVLTAYPAANRIQVSASGQGPDGVLTPADAVPGRFIVSIADPHGAVDRRVLDTVAAFIRPKLGTDEDVMVQSAQATPIVTTGSVLVRAGTTGAELAAMQEAAQAQWAAYLAGVPIGGVILLSKLVEAVMDAGALDAGNFDPAQNTSPIMINSSTSNVPLLPGHVATDGNPRALAGALRWYSA